MTKDVLPKRRYCAVWFPHLPTDRLRRQAGRRGEKQASAAMVTVTREGGAMRIAALDGTAVAAGLARRLTLADARVRLPDLLAHDHCPEADQALLEAIADWSERYTPVVALVPPDALVIEISGSAHLFGGEETLMKDLCRRLDAMQISHRSAIAGTAACARACARFGNGGIVPPAGEGTAACALPVSALELGPEQTLALRRAGLKSIGDVAARPRKPFAARFGPVFVEALAALLGESDPPLRTRRPAPDFVVERRFGEPIGLEEDVSRALDGLIRTLTRSLEDHGRGGRVFEACFFRADGTLHRLSAVSGRALRNPDTISRLFATRLEALADPLDPGFGFDMIRLSAMVDEETAPSQSSFGDDAQEAEAVADLVDRLTARFGPAAVERFLPEDSHVPERAVRRVPAISTRAAAGEWMARQPGEPPLRPVLLFTPPERVETVAEVPDGPPFRFRWRRVLHEIVRAEGPERIAPEWWRRGENAQTRDYYRVEDAEGRRFWLFREGLYEDQASVVSWYMHGQFS